MNFILHSVAQLNKLVKKIAMVVCIYLLITKCNAFVYNWEIIFSWLFKLNLEQFEKNN